MNAYKNQLYLITFKKTQDYETVYNKFPSIYLWYKIKTCCRKKNTFFINKAPNPEDIAWKNLEFKKGYKYIQSKLCIFGLMIAMISASFVIQLCGEFLDSFLSEYSVYLFVVNIIVALLIGLLDDYVSDELSEVIEDQFNYWSYSDIAFYSILFQTIFKFISKGVFPILTYYLFNLIEQKKNNDYYDLVAKMFVIIEMDGFGYPLIDWLFNIAPKLKKFSESNEAIFSYENVEKEIAAVVDNSKGLSDLEYNEAFKKEEFDLKGNYSDILSIYWITMFYFPLYPIGIIQTFLNLLFRFITEKNLLINVYKRPNYTNPHFGFFSLNFFNFGIFLFLLGNFFFFKNEDNKEYFGCTYIFVMIIFFLLPLVFIIAKIIMCMTNYCCLDDNKSADENNLNNISINEKIQKLDYNLFNPFNQRENIMKIFYEFCKPENGEQIIEENQYNEIKAQLDNLDNKDLYELQEKFLIPKNMTFESKLLSWNYDDTKEFIIVKNERKELYNLLMQFGFLPYYEIGNFLRPRIKQFHFENPENIRSDSLRNLSMQENLTFSDSGNFNIYGNDKNYIMAYIDRGSNIKLYNIFEKNEFNEINDLYREKTIVCVNCFIYEGNTYIITLGLDNTMIIYCLDKEKDNIIVHEGNIGFTYSNKCNTGNFSLSSVKHDETIWIITSYYYDKKFKIYDFNVLNDNSYSDFIQFHESENIENQEENIISLEALFIENNRTYIIVRSPNSINIFQNNIFIEKLISTNGEFYINFKITPIDNVNKTNYIIATLIKKDLSEYYAKIFNIIEENQIQLNNKLICQVKVNLDLVDENQRRKRIKILEKKDNHEKYYIGNVLLWEKEYLILGTPFSRLDIIDYRDNIIYKNNMVNKPVGYVNNEEKIKNDDSDDEEGKNIITYDMSNKIEDPKYGSCFIMRDNKGKIQYIRASRKKGDMNLKIIQKKNSFDNFTIKEKLKRMKYSAFFFFCYYVLNLLTPLMFGLSGHLSKKEDYSKDEEKNLLLLSSYIYLAYIAVGIFFKICINDITLSVNNCSKIMIYLFITLKWFAIWFIFFYLCRYNKTVIYFLAILNVFYISHILFYIIVYTCRITYVLKIYLLGFLFYQISRLSIILCCMVMIFCNATHFEIYIYLLILCVISAYMYLANYFIAYQDKIKYKNIYQGIFNYPFEWINIFCCLCDRKKNQSYDNKKCCLWSCCEDFLNEKCPRCKYNEEDIEKEKKQCIYKFDLCLLYILCCCNCFCNCCCNFLCQYCCWFCCCHCFCCNNCCCKCCHNSYCSKSTRAFKFWDSLENFENHNPD